MCAFIIYCNVQNVFILKGGVNMNDKLENKLGLENKLKLVDNPDFIEERNQNVNKTLKYVIYAVAGICVIIILLILFGGVSFKKSKENSENNSAVQKNTISNVTRAPSNTVRQPSNSIPPSNFIQYGVNNGTTNTTIYKEKVELADSYEIFKTYQKQYNLPMVIEFGNSRTQEWIAFRSSMEEIQAEYQGKIMLKSIDVNSNTEFSNIRFKKIPTYVFVNSDGDVVNTISRNVSKGIIIAGLSCMGQN